MEEGYIHIANNIFPTLLAISHEEQAQGLMYVEPPAPVMTFVYASPQINRFWMKNTQSPLDILFCHQGRVQQICYGEPHSTAMIGDNRLTDLVIELPFGTVYASQIKLGHSVGLVKPSQEEIKKLIATKCFFNLRAGTP
jgi:uncharacterized membrane protein (UPF0127 family)